MSVVEEQRAVVARVLELKDRGFSAFCCLQLVDEDYWTPEAKRRRARVAYETSTHGVARWLAEGLSGPTALLAWARDEAADAMASARDGEEWTWWWKVFGDISRRLDELGFDQEDED